MVTTTKTYSNLKAAHRQWRHPGHCHYVHGENWTFHVTFGAYELDHQNFVIDFGGLRSLKARLEQQFDHVLLIDHDDPQIEFFKSMHELELTDLRVVNSASAEGLAALVFQLAQECIATLNESERVFVVKVVAEEDTKNVATYQPVRI